MATDTERGLPPAAQPGSLESTEVTSEPAAATLMILVADPFFVATAVPAVEQQHLQTRAGARAQRRRRRTLAGLTWRWSSR